jgi:hypothetical protein
LVSVEDRRRRLRASMRCSFMMTASCLSFPMRRFFSLSSLSSCWAREVVGFDSSSWSYCILIGV